MPDELVIDGARGEGGGQIVRTALFLSVFARRPVVIERIRAGRPKPGLKPQHVAILQALKQLCGATVEGGVPGSGRLEFRPGPTRRGTYRVDVGTAGSVPLVLQTLLPVCLLADGEVTMEVRGGTEAAFAPVQAWFQNVYLPLVAPAFADVDVTVDRRGFLPAGGGRVLLRATGVGPDPEAVRGRIRETLGGPFRPAAPPWRIFLHSLAHESLRSRRVAERQAEAAANRFPEAEASLEYVDADSIGSSIAVWAVDESGNRMGWDALGDRRRPAEAVGDLAARGLAAALESGGTADEHLADHLVPWIGLGARAVRPARASPHFLTNLEVTRAFLGDGAFRWDSQRLSPRENPA